METLTSWDDLTPVDRAFYAQFGITGPEALELALDCMRETMEALSKEPFKFFEAYRHATNLLSPQDKLRIMSRHTSLIKVVK